MGYIERERGLHSYLSRGERQLGRVRERDDDGCERAADRGGGGSRNSARDRGDVAPAAFGPATAVASRRRAGANTRGAGDKPARDRAPARALRAGARRDSPSGYRDRQRPDGSVRERGGADVSPCAG